MKNNSIIIAAAVAAASLSSCTQVASPTPLCADRVATQSVQIGHKDCTLIQGRVSGVSKGFTILGLIPLTDASEAEATDNMYKASRESGAAPEGHARTYVNTSVERKSTYIFPIFTRPSIRVTGDLVQFSNDASSAQGRVERKQNESVLSKALNVLPF